MGRFTPPRGDDVLRWGKCGGAMKVIALVNEHEAIRKILDHLGLPPPPSRRATQAEDSRPSRDVIYKAQSTL
jgi:hypothetical protein